MKLVVLGAEAMADVPGLERHADAIDVAFAPDAKTLKAEIADADAALSWHFKIRDLAEAWEHAEALKWIHWSGAGVDALLFPDLVESDVVLTNSRGIFDRAMAEYVLAYMLSFTKDLENGFTYQAKREWRYRQTERLSGAAVTIVGVGSIARDVARVLEPFDMEVTGVGRTARDGVPVFGAVRGIDDLHNAVAEADWVVAVLPSTPETQSVFDAEFFAAMKPQARFINIGRGDAVDEAALVAALEAGTIAGAALDVFQTEPLPKDDPMWTAPNLIITPHITGDYIGYQDDIFAVFERNLDAFRDGGDLVNVVDKRAGYVRD